MVEVVQMSMKEADRYAVIQQVIQRTMGQSDAALWLNISVRQVKRLVRRKINGYSREQALACPPSSNRACKRMERDLVQWMELIRAAGIQPE